tara:strand:+ start:231 stop:926 length:696 start_codon:yes stop_codon:yes gene_type:complete
MKIPILMYHSIIDDHNDSVSIISFQKQMILMKKMGYQTINFKELNNNNSNKKFIITFDDGYESIFLNAFPILKKLGFNATCFIVTNKIGQYNDWDINNNNFKKMKLMNLDQINEWVLNGFDVGSHSMDHLDLPKLNNEEKINQIVNSKKFLNDMLNINTETFAYPYGSYDIESSDIVKRYYEFAVTTRRSRYIKEKFNNELLPRIPISKNDNLLKFFLKIKTPYEDIKFKD